MVIAYLGLGSNLGDRDQQIQRAVAALALVPGVQVLAQSRLIEAEPVGGPAQPRYRNGALKIATTLTPHALHGVLQQLERDAGRVPSAERNLPRPLDLDLLLFGDQQLDTKELVVPHPRMHGREFVRLPLLELGVDLRELTPPAKTPVITDPEALSALARRWLHGGCSIGLVPTMGALHAGHGSLMQLARAECDRVIATVFVNPLQFGPGEDFARYPRSFAEDHALARSHGVDALFAPSLEDIYPPGFCSKIAVGREAEGMEGAARSGHFAGVATVVAKLFAIAQPTHGYFGQKDAQQLAVIRRMVKDFGFPITIRACPIVREQDGLALSSRNVYLNAADRAAAPVLYRALGKARNAYRAGERDVQRLLAVARAGILAEPRATLEYLELRRDPDLVPFTAGMPVTQPRMLVVARFGNAPPTRLLDNLALEERALDQPKLDEQTFDEDLAVDVDRFIHHDSDD